MTRYRDRREAGDFAAGETADAGGELGSLTKADLLAKAQELGVSPANNAMSKAELQAAIEQHQAAA